MFRAQDESLSKTYFSWKSKEQSFNILVSVLPDNHSLHPYLLRTSQTLSQNAVPCTCPIEQRIPVLLQHLRVISTWCSQDRAEALSSSRATSLHLRILLGVGGSLLALPRRGEKNETGYVGQSGKEKRALLCFMQPTHPRASLHCQPF